MRPSAWPQILNTGSESARATRAVITCASMRWRAWMLAMITSKRSSTESGKSRLPSLKMSDSVPRRIRIGTSSCAAAISSHCASSRSRATPRA